MNSLDVNDLNKLGERREKDDRINGGKGRGYTLWKVLYELLQSRFESDEGEGDFFGIRIRQRKRGDSRIVDDSEAKGITEDYEEAERLFAVFVRETVMPVHLLALVDDWQSTVHPA